METKNYSQEKSISSFYQFVINNRDLFELEIYTQECDDPKTLPSFVIRYLSKEKNHLIDGTYFTNCDIGLYFQMDFDKIFEEYSQLEISEGEVKLDRQFFNEKLCQKAFVEVGWHKIIMHLKPFNQTHDNYCEIAKLAQNLRGTFIGSIYNI